MLQESVFGNKPTFHCASAEAVKAAAAAQAAVSPLHPAEVPKAGSRQTLSDRPDAVNRLTGKRLAPALGNRTLNPAKKVRTAEESDNSEHLTEPQHDISPVMQTQQADVHPSQHQPKARRVIPEQIISAVDQTKSAHISISPGAYRSLPEMIEADQCRKSSSTGKRAYLDRRHVSQASPLAPHGSDNLCSQLPSDFGDSSVNRSDQDSEDDVDGEEGSEGGSEDGQPSKLFVEFGAAGDAWWNDFIAAKEEMLTDVLQARSCIPHASCPTVVTTVGIRKQTA